MKLVIGNQFAQEKNIKINNIDFFVFTDVATSKHIYVSTNFNGKLTLNNCKIENDILFLCTEDIKELTLKDIEIKMHSTNNKKPLMFSIYEKCIMKDSKTYIMCNDFAKVYSFGEIIITDSDNVGIYLNEKEHSCKKFNARNNKICGNASPTLIFDSSASELDIKNLLIEKEEYPINKNNKTIFYFNKIRKVELDGLRVISYTKLCELYFEGNSSSSDICIKSNDYYKKSDLILNKIYNDNPRKLIFKIGSGLKIASLIAIPQLLEHNNHMAMDIAGINCPNLSLSIEDATLISNVGLFLNDDRALSLALRNKAILKITGNSDLKLELPALSFFMGGNIEIIAKDRLPFYIRNENLVAPKKDLHDLRFNSVGSFSIHNLNGVLSDEGIDLTKGPLHSYIGLDNRFGKFLDLIGAYKIEIDANSISDNLKIINTKNKNQEEDYFNIVVFLANTKFLKPSTIEIANTAKNPELIMSDCVVNRAKFKVLKPLEMRNVGIREDSLEVDTTHEACYLIDYSDATEKDLQEDKKIPYVPKVDKENKAKINLEDY